MTEEIRAILIKLETNGDLRPENLIELGSDPSSPLYGHFEWDNEKASHEYRKTQARRLIRSFVVQCTYYKTVIEVPQFVRSSKFSNGYVSTMRLRDSREEALNTVTAEFARADAALVRAQKLAIVLDIEEDVARLRKHIKSIRERFEEAA